jgi:segregation and condensation protein A
MTVADLELDLEVFSGPFDLLLTLVLREEVDLLEVDLADVVLAYLDHLEARGELDLEVTTEFLVLIAALLELKSRLMLPRAEAELVDLEPVEAAEELLARMLEARRYRSAAEHLRELLAGQDGLRYRAAPPPAWLRARPRWRTWGRASTSPRGSGPRSAASCATRRRSTSRTWGRSASASPTA